MPRKFVLAMLALAALVGMLPAQADDSTVVGVRGGFGATDRSENFNQYDVYGAFALPWSWQSSSGWMLGTQLDASAGVLTRSGTTGFMGSVGPSVLFGKQGIGLQLVGGVEFTLLSEHEFGTVDLGGPVQFSSHIGLSYDLPWNLTIGYQFTHTSNAEIYDSNPGIEMHLFNIGYRL